MKKVLWEERKEVPLSMSSAMFYLKSQRLIFLKLFEICNEVDLNCLSFVLIALILSV